MRQPIIYVGNFRPSWSTETYISKSFQDIGVAVVQMQEDERTADEVISACGLFNPRLLLYTRTWGLKDGKDAMFRVIEAVKGKQVPTATFSLDLYWGLNREPMIASDPMFRTDIVFSADGGRNGDWQAAGINHVWLPPGVYGRDCFRGAATPEFEALVGFTGTVDFYHAEWPFRRALVDALREKYGAKFRRWGNRENVRGWDLNDLYASCKVMVGDSLARPYYWSDRVTETLGRGGFLVAPEIEGMRGEGFNDDADDANLMFYEAGDLNDCLERVDEALEFAEATRHDIVERGMHLVRQRHTYEDRCLRILGAVEALREGRERDLPAAELYW